MKSAPDNSSPAQHADYERPVIDAAARILDAWAEAGLIDGNDTSHVGDPDPEWLRAKIAVRIVRLIDGQAGGR